MPTSRVFERILEQMNAIDPEDDGKQLHEQLGVLCLCKTSVEFSAALVKAHYITQEESKTLDFNALRQLSEASKKKLTECFEVQIRKQHKSVPYSKEAIQAVYPHCAYPSVDLMKKYGRHNAVVDEKAEPKKTSCDLELVLAAAQVTYAISVKDKLLFNAKNPDAKASWIDAERTIRDKGYRIDHMTTPKTLGGTSSMPLTVACLKPVDETSPIVIAFKGTKFSSKDDLVADMHIAARGLASKAYREAAYTYYENIRQANPGRKIIITGHSLGGNLASYVGAKAYRHGEKHGDLMVRTFNAAPVDLQNASVEKNREQYPIYDYFINYRVQNDVVSSNIKHYADKGIRHGRYGSMVTLASDADPHHAHHLRTLKKIMPDVLLKQKIGDKLCLEQEKILGVFETLRYETLKCCQKARSRRSAKNQDDIEPLVQLFETCKASIDSALAVNDLDGAMVILIDFMDQLNVGEEQKESITNIVSDAYGYRPISIDERKMSVSVFSYCKKIIQDGLAALSSCVDYLVAKFSSNPSTNEENDDDDDDDLGSTRSRSFP